MTLIVNDRVVGRQVPDEVKVVRWTDVPLADGENLIVLRAQDGSVAVRHLKRIAATN